MKTYQLTVIYEFKAVDNDDAGKKGHALASLAGPLVDKRTTLLTRKLKPDQFGEYVLSVLQRLKDL